MLATTTAELEQRVDAIIGGLPAGVQGRVTRGTGIARCGGGTMPKAEIPSVTIDVAGEASELERLANVLRTGSPAVVGYLADGRFRLDLRTVFGRQDGALAARLGEALTQTI